ncbi:hypothetical protein [Aliiruegeria lutimaris]|nr:hypothetical protein [Aliiruegeria lutimaris]
MVLFYDIAGDVADHDDWHSREHFQERLSVDGFLRAIRWVATKGSPRYLVTYEVLDVAVATSEPYLARLNNPSPWTQEMMPRFRGMVRGFCNVVASSGFGLGTAAVAIRFNPEQGAEAELTRDIEQQVLPSVTREKAIVGAHFLKPDQPPPMTREQSLRGPDQAMPWLLIASAYDAAALDRAIAGTISSDELRKIGAMPDITTGCYDLHHTATAEEACRSARAAFGRGLASS